MLRCLFCGKILTSRNKSRYATMSSPVCYSCYRKEIENVSKGDMRC